MENDDEVWGRLYAGKSDYSSDVKLPTPIRQFDDAAQHEDMSGTDSKGKRDGDTAMLSYITGWHPFLRFLYRTADMEYAYIPDPRQRAHKFITTHKKTFWACFWFDWLLVLVGSSGIVALAIIAVAKTLGLM